MRRIRSKSHSFRSLRASYRLKSEPDLLLVELRDWYVYMCWLFFCFPDPYVKIYLLYSGQRIAKKKTHVKKRTLHPVFNESFVFDVPYNEGLQNISLEFLVLDWDRVAKNEVIGRMEIGAQTDGLEKQHWQDVMACPRKQIAEWHKMHD